MNDDVKALVERLNDHAAGHALTYGHTGICGEAATALTAQAEEIERLNEILTFDCTGYPDMEAAAIKWANKISGPKGGASFHPDPVILLEICEDIASAALKAAQEVGR